MLAALWLGAPPAAAQGLGVGVKGGLNFSTVVFDGTDFPATRTAGIVAGAFVTVPVLGWFTLQPEVLYSAKGADFDNGVRSELRLDYLEVPILLRVPLGAAGGARLYAVAGPSFGYRLRARSRTTFSGATEEIDIADDIEQLDLGLAAGAGIALRALAVEARYTHGLSDIDTDKDDRGGVAVRNRAFAVTLGLRF